MNIRKPIQDMSTEFTAYRRTLHRNPQTAFEETFASNFVADKLSTWGIVHERGLGKTGIVATVTGSLGEEGKSIGLRADMDALDIIEVPNKDWASTIQGKMHGCGHDGHTVMLLAAAKYLSENNGFKGKVHFIFQPAEENGKGAKAMIADRFLERYPCDAVYALHNWPYHPLGTFDINPAESMACVDSFSVTIEGKGGHASMPHTVTDPIVIAAQIISALQNVISRETDPFDPAVLSITNINGGTGAFNVIPSDVTFSGTVRTYCQNLRRRIEQRIQSISQDIAGSFGASAQCTYVHVMEPTINTPEHAALCVAIAEDMVGKKNVITDGKPSMGGEDFGVFLQHAPGAYIKIGQGIENQPQSPCNQGLHNAAYDFNDGLIPIGVEYLVRLAEKHLSF